jgi:hypothetical protein
VRVPCERLCFLFPSLISRFRNSTLAAYALPTTCRVSNVNRGVVHFPTDPSRARASLTSSLGFRSQYLVPFFEITSVLPISSPPLPTALTSGDPWTCLVPLYPRETTLEDDNKVGLNALWNQVLCDKSSEIKQKLSEAQRIIQAAQAEVPAAPEHVGLDVPVNSVDSGGTSGSTGDATGGGVGL